VVTKRAKVVVSFAFRASESGATFRCKLDRAAFRRCTSAKRYTVKPGKHSFAVAAVGVGGKDATPASFHFRVVRKKTR